MSAAASRTCSQLSNTSNRWRPSSAAATLSATLRPACCVRPRTAATASGTAAGIGDGGKFDDPHPVGEALSANRVRNLQCESGLTDAAYTDQALPTDGFSVPPFQVGDPGLLVPRSWWWVRVDFPGVVSVFSAGNSVRRPGARTWKDVDWFGDIA